MAPRHLSRNLMLFQCDKDILQAAVLLTMPAMAAQKTLKCAWSSHVRISLQGLDSFGTIVAINE